jgi:hypothetical protein
VVPQDVDAALDLRAGLGERFADLTDHQARDPLVVGRQSGRGGVQGVGTRRGRLGEPFAPGSPGTRQEGGDPPR